MLRVKLESGAASYSRLAMFSLLLACCRCASFSRFFSSFFSRRDSRRSRSGAGAVILVESPRPLHYINTISMCHTIPKEEQQIRINQLSTTWAWKVTQSAPSVLPSVSTVSFELTDLWPWSSACVRAVTIACLELNVKVRGQNMVSGTSSESSSCCFLMTSQLTG